MDGEAEAAALLAEVRRRTGELFGRLRAARDLSPEDTARIEEVARDVEQRFGRETCDVLVIAGDAEGRRALDAAIGTRLFAAARRPGGGVILLRRGPAHEYTACLRDGTVQRFHERTPDRDETFARAIARAESELVTEEEAASALRGELARAERDAPTQSLARPRRASAFERAWRWLIARLAALFGVSKKVLPAPTSTREVAIPRLEAALDENAARATRARAHADTLASDRARYTAERHASFRDDLRAFAGSADLVELAVEVPSDALPPRVTLIDSPDSPADVDGCLVVADGERAKAFAELRPLAISAQVTTGELRDALEQIRRDAPLVAAARAVTFARAAIGAAFAAATRAESASRTCIAALEEQRLGDAAEFRGRSMARMEKAIGDAARDVLGGAIAKLAPRIAEVKAEWTSAVRACGDKKSVEASVRAIQDAAPARLAAIADQTMELVLAELQRVSDSLQIWVVEEIHARHELARRASMSDAGGAIVMNELHADDLPALDTAPLGGAMAAFENRRVGIGLGGAAAGAVVGTLIAPGVGTAIGAFLGVFAGFLKGTDSLKDDCVAKLEACLDEGEKQLRRQLGEREQGFATALRASLEETLDLAIARFERSLAGVLTLEQQTLADTRATLARLAEARTWLDAHGVALADLARRRPRGD